METTMATLPVDANKRIQDAGGIGLFSMKIQAASRLQRSTVS